jgi:hypothetical protein
MIDPRQNYLSCRVPTACLLRAETIVNKREKVAKKRLLKNKTR